MFCSAASVLSPEYAGDSLYHNQCGKHTALGELQVEHTWTKKPQVHTMTKGRENFPKLREHIRNKYKRTNVNKCG